MEQSVADREPSAEESVKTRLQEATRRYGSLEAVARELKNRSIWFSDTNRSTVSKWLSNPTATAAFAAHLLKDVPSEAGQLRIAEPNTLWALPCFLARALRDNKRKTSLEAIGLSPDIIDCASGGHALEKLKMGEADVAIAGRELVSGKGFDANRKSQSSIARLCRIARCHLVGISTTPARYRWLEDINSATIGYPAGSAIRHTLESVATDWNIRANKGLKAFEDANATAEALRAGRIDIFVAWEPIITHIAHQIDVVRLPTMFGAMDIDIIVNTETKHPSSIRLYLRAIQAVIEEMYATLRKLKVSDAIVGDIADAVNQALKLSDTRQMVPTSIESVLDTCRFTVDEVNLAALLKLWEAEIRD